MYDLGRGNTFNWGYDPTQQNQSISQWHRSLQDQNTANLAELKRRESADTYNPGINYSNVVQPFLGPSQNSETYNDMLRYMVTNAAPIRRAATINVDNSNVWEDRLKALLENPDNIANSGVYRFQLNQGLDSIKRSAAAKGMAGSGNVLAELMKYGEGTASQAYNTEADRLAGLTKSRYDYILGQQKNAIAGQTADADSYNAESGRMKTIGDLTTSDTNNRVAAGRLALDAASAQAGDYWNAQKTAQGWYQMNPQKMRTLNGLVTGIW